MPGIITHYLCANAVLGGLSADMRKTVEKNRSLYNLGAQGPDVFFYYLPGFLHKDTRSLGGLLHKSNFKGFFGHICETVRENAPETDKNAAMAYFSGFLTHYALDMNAHPYIYYKTGFKRKEDKRNKIKYSVYHRNMETAIDTLLLKSSSGERPSDKKLWQLIRAPRDDARYVAKLISESVKSAYGIDITDKQVLRAMAYMSNVTRILQSRKGRRKRLLELLETPAGGKGLITSLIHDQELTDGLDYLNSSKKPWFLPWDDKNALTDSFGELFDDGVADAVKMIGAFEGYMTRRLVLSEMLSVTGNYSFSSGLDSDRDIEFAFYDIIFTGPKAKR